MDRNFGEILRRQDADANFESNANAKMVDRPEDQTFILINVANSGHKRPYSKTPAFRVLAFAKDKTEGERIYKEKFEPVMKERVYSSYVDRSFLICKTEARQDDLNYGPDTCRRLALENEIGARQREIDFRARVKESAGDKAKFLETDIDPSPLPELPPETKTQDPGCAVKNIPTTASMSLTRDMETRGQGYIACSVLLNGDEPSITIYGCWDTEEEAKEYVINGIGRQTENVHLFVVRMYEWLHPDLSASEKIPETFRKDELNKIMAAPKTLQLAVDEFRAKNPNRLNEGFVLAKEALITVDNQDPRILERINAVKNEVNDEVKDDTTTNVITNDEVKDDTTIITNDEVKDEHDAMVTNVVTNDPIEDDNRIGEVNP